MLQRGASNTAGIIVRKIDPGYAYNSYYQTLCASITYLYTLKIPHLFSIQKHFFVIFYS